MECFDATWINRVMQRFSQCGEDIECGTRCMGGFAFQLSLEVTNQAQMEQQSDFPAGMIFKAEDKGVQNMLVAREEKVLLSAGSSKTVCVTTYCLNSNLQAPDETDTYVSGGGVSSPCMVEILQGGYGKNIDNVKFAVQERVRDGADNGTISDQLRAFLGSLHPAN